MPTLGTALVAIVTDAADVGADVLVADVAGAADDAVALDFDELLPHPATATTRAGTMNARNDFLTRNSFGWIVPTVPCRL